MLKHIKKKLGKKCKFLSFLNRDDKWFVKAHLVNFSKGVDKVTIEIGKHPFNLTRSNFEDVEKLLENYESQGTVSSVVR